MLDEMMLAGELQEPSKKAVTRVIEVQDQLVEAAKQGAGAAPGAGLAGAHYPSTWSQSMIDASQRVLYGFLLVHATQQGISIASVAGVASVHFSSTRMWYSISIVDRFNCLPEFIE